jgi:hypothetical protein
MAPSSSATTKLALGGLDTDHAAAAMQVLQLETGRCYVDTLTLVRDPLALGGTFTARVTIRGGGRVIAVNAPHSLVRRRRALRVPDRSDPGAGGV